MKKEYQKSPTLLVGNAKNVQLSLFNRPLENVILMQSDAEGIRNECNVRRLERNTIEEV